MTTARQSEHSHNGDAHACPVFRMMPQPLQERATEDAHLWGYLHGLPVDEIGVPQYYPQLNGSLKGLPDPNLIYPVGHGVYIHIRSDQSDSRNFYIPIEAGMGVDTQDAMEDVEIRLIDHLDALDNADATDEERASLLLETLDKVASASKGTSDGGEKGKGKGEKGKGKKSKGGKLHLDKEALDTIRYRLIRDKVGMGVLQPLIQDPYIEDISCSGIGPIFVEHKIFDGLKSVTGFETNEELDGFVIRLSEKIGKPVTFRDPVVDATLPDGSRINIVYGSDLSRRGSNFTIRKFASNPMSILDLVGGGALSYQVAAYLSLVIGEGMNIFVSGETASGKTTLLNAITTFIPPSGKIVSIEDTPELQMPHGNWIREVVRGSTKSTDGSAVTMFDLLKAALRQRPNEIIIGEIRGEEGAIAFQAMQTGHACMATFHAATVEKLIQRMTGNPINVPKTYIDNLNVVVIQSAVRLPNGKPGRRVMSVNEIVGYDSSSDSFSFIEVFRWDPVKDFHEFTGNMNSFLLEQRIASKRGIPPNKKRKIYEEMDRRIRILQRLAEQKITGFDELYKVLAQAYRKGLFK